MTKTKPTPWYRIKRWAREGQWDTQCWSHDHMAFVKGTAAIEVVLENGRMVRAEWHHHAPDENCRIIKRAYNSHLNVSIEDWFR